MTDAMKKALAWMRERGGSAAVARVKGGGRVYLAQGETAPFMPSTAKALINAGLARYLDTPVKKAVRFELTEKGTK